MALPKGSPAPDPHHTLLHFSLDEGEFDEAVYDQLSPKLRETIAQSPEYKARNGGLPVSPNSNGGGIDLDDEIPF